MKSGGQMNFRNPTMERREELNEWKRKVNIINLALDARITLSGMKKILGGTLKVQQIQNLLSVHTVIVYNR